MPDLTTSPEKGSNKNQAMTFLSVMRASVRHALRFWRVILTIGPIAIALFYLAFMWGRQADITKLHEGSERRLALLSAALFSPIDKFSYLPQVAATFPVLSATLSAPDNPVLLAQANKFLTTLNTSAKSAVVYLLNRQGIAIASSNWQERDSFVGKDYSFRPYFKQAMEQGSGKFYGMGTTSLLPGYYVSSAVLDGETPLGVVVVKVDMGSFDNGWKQRDQMAITDANGIIFLSSISDWKYRPLHALGAETLAQLRRTRQYENALRDALDTEVLEDLGPDEQVVRIALPASRGHVPTATTYFTKSAKLAGSDWNVNVFIPIDDIDSRARWTAGITMVVLAFVGMIFLYVRQVRANLHDREISRQALEAAHANLGQKHLELQVISEKLQVTSATDPLTGAFNRRYFFDTIEKFLFSQRSTDASLSLIMTDIDYFKQINDRYGHPVGDQVLKALTELAKKLLRDADLFVRFGGEEFVIALPNASLADAVAIAQRLCEQVRNAPFGEADDPIVVTISCGVAQYGPGDDGIDAVIKRADTALYKAKQQGRNCVISADT